MAATVGERLDHILDATAKIRILLAGKSVATLQSDPFVRAALERFLEIISEASRHIPSGLKERHPEIAWLDIANIGNRLRHGYDIVDARILWDVYAHDIYALDKAVMRMKDKS